MDYCDRLLTGFGSVSLLAFTMAAILSGSIETYHASFYSYFHPITWVAFAFVTATGVLLLIHGVSSGRGSASRGAVILAAGYGIFFCLPRLAGFTFWAPMMADGLVHLSIVEDILHTGRIDSMYPFLHISVASSSLITGVEMQAFQAINGISVTVLFIAGIALFTRTLLRSRRALIAGGVAGSLLVFGKYQHNLMPWFFDFALIPLGLYAIERAARNTTLRWRLLSVGIVIPIALFHPMTAIVFGMLLAAVTVMKYTDLKIRSPQRGLPARYWFLLVLITSTIHISWYLSIPQFQNRLAYSVSSLFLGRLGAAESANTAGGTVYTPLQLIQQFILEKWLGAVTIIALGGLVIIFIWTYWYLGAFSDSLQECSTLYRISLYFGIGLGLAVFLLAVDAIATNPIRLNQVTIFASMLLIGAFLWMVSGDQFSLPRSAIPRLLVVFGIVVIAVSTPFVMYPESQHLTETELSGTEWHVESRNPDIRTMSQHTAPKVTDYVLPPGENLAWENQPFYPAGGAPFYVELPRRLGYESNETLSETTDGQAYVTLSERGTRWWYDEPPNRWSSIRRYTESDIQRAQSDRTAAQIYTNGDYWILLTGRSPQTK